MAPNKRKEGKRLLSIWLDGDVYARFSKMSAASNVSMTAILSEYIIEKVECYENNHAGEGSNVDSKDTLKEGKNVRD